jgi:hypothetical protein
MLSSFYIVQIGSYLPYSRLLRLLPLNYPILLSHLYDLPYRRHNRNSNKS